MPTKSSRRPQPHQDDDSRYESQQRMSWIEEGGIDLRAARANLVEFVAGLYHDLQILAPHGAVTETEPALNLTEPSARRVRASTKSARRAKAPVRRKARRKIRK
jgi:hypothetical protein